MSQLPSKLAVLKTPAQTPTKQRSMCNSVGEKELFILCREPSTENQDKRNYNTRPRKDLTDKNWWRVVSGRKDTPTFLLLSQERMTLLLHPLLIEYNGVAHTTVLDKANVFCQTFVKNVDFVMLMMSPY